MSSQSMFGIVPMDVYNELVKQVRIPIDPSLSQSDRVTLFRQTFENIYVNEVKGKPSAEKKRGYFKLVVLHKFRDMRFSKDVKGVGKGSSKSIKEKTTKVIQINPKGKGNEASLQSIYSNFLILQFSNSKSTKQSVIK